MQLRDAYPRFTQAGAEVVAIGMGWPGAAAAFKEERDIPFPLLVDHRKETYRALDLRRASAWEVIGPSMLVRNLRGYARKGFSLAKQDWHQLAGTVVAAAGGEILFSHRARDPADNAPTDRLLAALTRSAA